MVDELLGCDPEDGLFLEDWVQPGCGTAELERRMGLGIWNQSAERQILVAILREFLAERLGEELKNKLLAHSIWDLPSEEPIVGYLIERMGWVPSGVEAEPCREANLRAVVARFETSGELTEYAQDWLRLRSRGW